MTYRHLLPLGYTYETRLRGSQALAVFLLQEYGPLALALILGLGASPVLVALLAFSTLSAYECGYLINDTAASAMEPGGNRLARRGRISTTLVLTTHAVFFGGVLTALTMLASARIAALNAGLSLGIVGLLAVHSSDRVVNTGVVRIGTFAALAFYKYAPFVVPSVGWQPGLLLLAATFACYGAPRVIAYSLRKFAGEERSTDLLGRPQAACQMAFLLIFSWVPIRWIAGGELALRGAAMVWLGYCGSWLVLEVGHALRH